MGKIVIGKEVRFKRGWYDNKPFIVRGINDKKLIMGDYYQVAEISRVDKHDVYWRAEVLQEELVPCDDIQEGE